MNDAERRASFKRMLQPGAGVLLPGVGNALSARIVADLGFAVCYVSGAGVTNWNTGLPDLSFVGLADIAQHVRAIREVFPGPLVCDIDTGFGNPVNVVHTVRTMERAGADCLQMEDQVFPKKCGHFNGKGVIPKNEMVDKVKAFVDARKDPNLLCLARTDAIAVEGFEAALDRANAYREAGADATFVEAPTSLEDMAQIPKRLAWPQILNIVAGGKTPDIENARAREMGFAGIIYANASLQGAVLGMQRSLGHLKKRGSLIGADDLMVHFDERQRVLHKGEYDAYEAKYASKPE